MNLRNYKWICFLIIAFAFVCTHHLTRKAMAQGKGYPEKPIEIIIGFAPGGPIDVGTRIVTQELTKQLNVPITIAYKPGASGAISISSVINAKPDGYTLLSLAIPNVIGPPSMEKNPTFDPLKDLTCIAFYANSPTLMSTNTSSKLTSFDVMVKFAKENPGKLNCATSGVGTTGHFMLEYLKIQGVVITHIPTKGATPTVTELLGNHVDLGVTAYPPVAPHIKSGELRVLVSTHKIKQEPEAPTLAEKGFPEAAAFGYGQGFFGPPNLPKPILDRLSVAFEKTMQLPSVIQGLEKVGFTPVYRGPEAFKKQIADEYRIVKEIAKNAGMVK